MTERAYTLLVDNTRQKVVQWTGLLNGDTGQWYEYSGAYPEKFMQVFGTFGTGGSCKPEGSNEDPAGTVTYPIQLRDSSHTLIAFTAAGGDTILQNPRIIRPNVSAGDGTTSLTVLLHISINMR
jgi:hypothetical protein